MNNNVCAFCYTNDVSANEVGVCKDCLPATFPKKGDRAITVQGWLHLRVEIAKRTLTLFDGHYVVYLHEQGAEIISCEVPEGVMLSDLNWLNHEMIEAVTCEKCKKKLDELDKMYKEQGLRQIGVRTI